MEARKDPERSMDLGGVVREIGSLSARLWTGRGPGHSGRLERESRERDRGVGACSRRA